MKYIRLIEDYSNIVKKLKEENIIRTRNVVGEIGEFYAINYFNKTPGLPKLQKTMISTKNVDAISNKGERYSIKTTTGKSTSLFLGIKNDKSNGKFDKIFEYVLIIQLDKCYKLKKILQINWEEFWKLKEYNSRCHSWKLSINRKLIEKAKIIYEA